MAANEPLPSSFDVIVLGTGLPEAMVSASLSRVGKKVLHIDRNEFYGAHWATFTFQSLQEWIHSYQSNVNDSIDDVEISEHIIPLSDMCIKNIVVESNISAKNPIIQLENPDETQLNNKTKVTQQQQPNGEVPETECPLNEISEKECTATEISDVEYPTNEICQIKKGEDLKDNVSEFAGQKPQYTTISENESSANEISDKESSTNELCKVQNEDDLKDNRSVVLEQESQQSKTNKGASTVISGDHVIDNSDVNMKKSINEKPPSPSLVSQAKIKSGGNDITVEDFEIVSRKFNLDITSKFLFSAGALVKTIIKANISHYAEFKVVDRILMCRDDDIVEVPCNRADVFSSTFLSMIEKRMLMKFLTFCLEYDETAEEIEEYKGKPFHEFLKSRRLSEKLQMFVIYSIAMVKPDTVTETALIETKNFIKSLGKYGKSPFIWPLFGTGELPQAFCRMSAVFGGLFCLRKTAESLSFDTECIKVVIDGQNIDCKQIVLEKSYLPNKYHLIGEDNMTSKAILITNHSLISSSEEHVSFLTIPPLAGKQELVNVVEVGPASSACPSGLFVLYLTCPSQSTAIEDLQEYTQLLTCKVEDSKKPKLLWSLYFNQVEFKFKDVPKNVFVTSMPGSTLGFKSAVEEAENIFNLICPEEEFMLAVPNPEDIIWGDDDKNVQDKVDDVEDENNAIESEEHTADNKQDQQDEKCLNENEKNVEDKNEASVIQKKEIVAEVTTDEENVQQ